jgi:hypothetical protein
LGIDRSQTIPHGRITYIANIWFSSHHGEGPLKTVVIFGAKPAASLPPGDAIYSANAAIMGREAESASYAERVTVASALVLARGLKADLGNMDLYRHKLRTVRNSGFDRLVLFADPGTRNFAKVILADLADGHPKGAKVYSVQERRELVRRIGQCGYPVTDKSFWHQDRLIVLRDLIEILKVRIGWLFGQVHKDVRAKYRPSTGILALLVAIAENGPEAKYVISGIGLNERNQFLVDGQISRNKANPATVLPKHVQADVILLRALSQRFRITTTEPELQEILSTYEIRQ